MSKKKNTKENIAKKLLIVVNIILIGGVIFLFLNGLGKLIYIYLLFTIVVPILVFYIKVKLLSKKPKTHLVVDSNGKISKVEYKNKNKNKGKSNNKTNETKNDIKNCPNQSYKPSQSPNLQLDIYKQVSKLFSNSLKNKLLKRDDILKFKDQLNVSLKENLIHYEKFNFENDANEIYVKLKNQHLSHEDYEGLLIYLNNLLKVNTQS